jgi:threonine aldolase
MAPGITEFVVEGERFEVKKAAAQKLDALKVLNNCHKNGGRDGEQDQMINGRSDTSAAVSTDNITDDDSTPVFTMPSIHKLREAQRRVEHDFRSDTVTVPTVHMMQVSFLFIVYPRYSIEPILGIYVRYMYRVRAN